jgi:hypothetical protein
MDSARVLKGLKWELDARHFCHFYARKVLTEIKKAQGSGSDE